MFFKTPVQLRKWFKQHHQASPELWVGFYKKVTGKKGITYHEALDEALCFGWIDGVRKSVDAASYMSRFSPRRARSAWSRINIRRAGELIKLGRMSAAGLKAFKARDPKRSGLYSFENAPRRLSRQFEQKLKANEKAREFFQAQAPWYRKLASFWVMSAKKEATRRRRLAILIRDSARGRPIPPLPQPRRR